MDGGGVVAYTFSPALWRQKQANICEFKASLACKVSSRTSQE